MIKDVTICLKTYAKQAGFHRLVVPLHERLPERVVGSCVLACTLCVERAGHYYLVTLDVSGDVTLTCQRCLHDFPYSYKNLTKLAVCTNDATAESLMEHHECFVAPDGQMDLIDVLTDELHLFAPEKHPNTDDCDVNINQWLGLQTKTR